MNISVLWESKETHSGSTGDVSVRFNRSQLFSLFFFFWLNVLGTVLKSHKATVS